MTTTSTFQGLDPEGRASSRILRPPGGGSNFAFGVGDSKQQQPVRRHKMASNIFGIPDNEPTPASRAPETDDQDNSACGNPEDAQKTCNQGQCGDAADHMGEAEIPEMPDSGNDGSEVAGESAQPAAPVAVASRRNPPGGKSSLVLG